MTMKSLEVINFAREYSKHFPELPTDAADNLPFLPLGDPSST